MTKRKKQYSVFLLSKLFTSAPQLMPSDVVDASPNTDELLPLLNCCSCTWMPARFWAKVARTRRDRLYSLQPPEVLCSLQPALDKQRGREGTGGMRGRRPLPLINVARSVDFDVNLYIRVQYDLLNDKPCVLNTMRGIHVNTRSMSNAIDAKVLTSDAI